jgi:succinyl-CoA synthetase beta subunit
MKIHEYQAKEIVAAFGVPIPRGQVAASLTEAESILAASHFPVVVKAQVHVGGRGKAGGVKLARSREEGEAAARAILGMNIKGSTVRKILIEEAAEIQRELYVGMVIDRAAKLPVLMCCAAGGVEIEEIAAQTPEKILKIHVKPRIGLSDYQIRRAAFFLGIPDAGVKTFRTILRGLYDTFCMKDCSLAEINPLVVTSEQRLLACDAKIIFDDNGLYRHPELEALRDEAEEEPLETEARSKKLSYVRLAGTIGCIVNGAGLAMATMDVIKHFGGEPANFLDIGGGAKSEQVTEALRIVTSDLNVKVVLINIFGGIVRCDLVAEGVLAALEQLKLDVPVVIRLCGTNEKEARAMLKDSALIAMPTMSEAARKAVEVSRG